MSQDPALLSAAGAVNVATGVWVASRLGRSPALGGAVAVGIMLAAEAGVLPASLRWLLLPGDLVADLGKKEPPFVVPPEGLNPPEGDLLDVAPADRFPNK